MFDTNASADYVVIPSGILGTKGINQRQFAIE